MAQDRTAGTAGDTPHPWEINVPAARYELKYLITERKARRMADFLAAYCVPDPFLGPAGGSYCITSLYFDTLDLRLYWERKTLQPYRMKARVRTYGSRCEGPVFLELKRRCNDVMIKTRAKVPRDRWPDAVAGDPEELATWAKDRAGATMIHDFRSQCVGLSLRPYVSIRYDRVPLVGRFDPGVRVTFDRGLRYRPTKDAWLAPDDREYRPFDFADVFFARESLVVLELKFDGTYPLWMIDAVRRFDLTRESFSKYMATVDLMLTESSTYSPTMWKSVVV